MIKAICFDLDGTLVDLVNSHYWSLNKALKEICDYEIPYDMHISYYNGKTTNTKLTMLENRGIIRKEQKKLIWELKQKYTIEYIDTFKLDEVKINMCEKLKTEGYKIVCVSNSIINTVKRILEVIGILRYFDFILGNEDYKNKPKPDPYPYQLAMELLKFDKILCLAVEDNLNGIISAKKSGCYVWEVDKVEDVNYENIKKKINEFDK